MTPGARQCPEQAGDNEEDGDGPGEPLEQEVRIHARRNNLDDNKRRPYHELLIENPRRTPQRMANPQIRTDLPIVLLPPLVRARKVVTANQAP